MTLACKLDYTSGLPSNKAAFGSQLFSEQFVTRPQYRWHLRKTAVSISPGVRHCLANSVRMRRGVLNSLHTTCVFLMVVCNCVRVGRK